MHFYLGLLFISLALTGGLMVPFINFLFRMKFTRQEETGEQRKTATTQFKQIREMHAYKAGVPTGGGILVAAVVAVLFAAVFLLGGDKPPGIIPAGYDLPRELAVLFYTFTAFGCLGFYDDVIKIVGYKKAGFFGLRMRHKLILQWLLGLGSAAFLYFGLGIDFINVPFFGIVKLGWIYFLLAAFFVVAMANAFDITDGLDGLSCGLLMICLTAFWVISLTTLDHVLSVFIAVWIGSLIAFLYFNIFPARIMLGNTGGLAFGATLAVVGLLTGGLFAMTVIGGVYIAEGLSSLLQLLSKRFMKHRIFPIAPLHHWLQLVGWEEPKIVARAWMTGLALAIFGVWVAML